MMSTSTATRNAIIDRAVDGNPTNNTVTLSAREYMTTGPGRFIKPTFATGVRQIVGDARLPKGQTISYAQLTSASYGYSIDDFLTRSVAQIYLDDGSPDFANRVVLYNTGQFEVKFDSITVDQGGAIKFNGLHVVPFGSENWDLVGGPSSGFGNKILDRILPPVDKVELLFDYGGANAVPGREYVASGSGYAEDLAAYDHFLSAEARGQRAAYLSHLKEFSVLFAELNFRYATENAASLPTPPQGYDSFEGFRRGLNPLGNLRPIHFSTSPSTRIPVLVVIGNRRSPTPISQPGDDIVITPPDSYFSIDGGATWLDSNWNPSDAPAEVYSSWTGDVEVADGSRRLNALVRLDDPPAGTSEAERREIAEVTERRISRDLNGNSVLANIPFAQLGSLFGSSLSRLIHVDNPLASLAIGTTLGVIGLNIGQQIEGALNGSASPVVAFRDFPTDLASAGLGAISSYLLGELFSLVDLPPVLEGAATAQQSRMRQSLFEAGRRKADPHRRGAAPADGRSRRARCHLARRRGARGRDRRADHARRARACGLLALRHAGCLHGGGGQYAPARHRRNAESF